MHLTITTLLATSAAAALEKATNLPGFIGTPQKAATPSPAPLGEKCEGFALDARGRLEAHCRDDQLNTWFTSLDLNACVGIRKGLLVFTTRGGFAHSCAACEVRVSTDVTLTCVCLDDLGGSSKSELVIGGDVGVLDGRIIKEAS
ncbi:cyanovirin-n domain-containing protein [Ophiocordyceps camponoti-floridani]|uniref:Cyanovirin-n domain-containing protein n=1 Tax=Ophiocordyceps camponoti-floridani TaxID=2030778 RepID=A0A8H4Q5X2_9HYPO|nr:cyanovirin-n domain-containing protein [Ophiocordyceps camponoti-floridani]